MGTVTAIATGTTDIEALLGADANRLLNHVSKGVPKEAPYLPGPDPMTEGMKLLNAIQDVYLDKRVTVA